MAAPLPQGLVVTLPTLPRPGTAIFLPFLHILVEGESIEANVDTGGFYLVLNFEIGRLIGLRPRDGERIVVMIRGLRVYGRLHRVGMTLNAEQGASLTVEVTSFVPNEEWDYPNFLGWPLCLERMRFAFEPDTTDSDGGWFHFGALDES